MNDSSSPVELVNVLGKSERTKRLLPEMECRYFSINSRVDHRGVAIAPTCFSMHNRASSG
jgi:hypothetical protein